MQLFHYICCVRSSYVPSLCNLRVYPLCSHGALLAFCILDPCSRSVESFAGFVDEKGQRDVAIHDGEGFQEIDQPVPTMYGGHEHYHVISPSTLSPLSPLSPVSPLSCTTMIMLYHYHQHCRLSHCHHFTIILTTTIIN